MRINLVTPFAEKDAAKALGARWDSAKKQWYIVDVPDLAPFMRWIPDLAAAGQDATAGGSSTTLKAGKSPAPPPGNKGIITKSTVPVPDCGCKVLPWDDCIHSPRP